MNDLRNDAIAALANAIQKIAHAHDRDLSAQVLEDATLLAREIGNAATGRTGSADVPAGWTQDQPQHKDNVQAAADVVRKAYDR